MDSHGITQKYAEGRDGSPIDRHPDTGGQLVGRTVPEWGTIVEIAEAVGAPTGLGYLGVDVVVDADLGPVVLEVNSHPGLEIQNVHRVGLIA